MSGVEHYRRAQRLLQDGHGETIAEAAVRVTDAQARATLATAAATIAAASGSRDQLGEWTAEEAHNRCPTATAA